MARTQIHGTQIQNETITGSQIQDNSVDSADIKDGSIKDIDIASDAAISPSKIAGGAGSGLDADKVDGYQTSTSATVNTIAVRDANGRIVVKEGVNGGIAFPNDAFGGTGDTATITLQNPSGGESQELTIAMTNDASDIVNVKTPSTTGLKHNGYTVWDSNNDGTGSGLDADMVDGIEGANIWQRKSMPVTNDLNDFKDINSFFTFDTGSGAANNTPYGNYAISTGKVFKVVNIGNSSSRLVQEYQEIYPRANIGAKWYRIWDGTAWGSWTQEWNSANDGTGSGLDADLLDGLESTAFARSGYGLGTAAQLLANGTDLNTLKVTGFYRVNAAVNVPPRVTGDNSSIWHYILVIQHDNSWVVQNAWEYSTGTMFTRVLNSSGGGTWTSWTKSWTDVNDGTGSGLDADMVDGVQLSGLAEVKASSSDTQITATTQTTVATITPAVQGNYYITTYYRVVTADTNVTITLEYTDGSGAQSIDLVAGGQAVGSYTVVPVMINAMSTAAINVKVIAGTANQVYVSTNIARM
jgi:hypothetical protein